MNWKCSLAAVRLAGMKGMSEFYTSTKDKARDKFCERVVRTEGNYVTLYLRGYTEPMYLFLACL